MNEIYWITRLGSLHNIGVIMTIVAFILFVTCWLISVSTDDWTNEDICSDKQKKKLRKGANYAIIPFFIGILMWTFIPTEAEAFLIYALGGTIDYIKQNPVARQLPDKCVDAIDMWVTNLNRENENNNKN